MKTLIKKSAVCVLLFLFALINTGCSERIPDNNVYSSTYAYEEFREFFGEDFRGHQLGFYNPLHGMMGHIVHADAADDNLHLLFSNFYGSAAEYVLKIFLNNASVYFSVDGREGVSSFYFYLNHGETVTWNINLEYDSDVLTHAELTAIIVRHPRAFQYDVRFFEHQNYGIISRHYFFVGDSSLGQWVLPIDSDLFVEFKDYANHFFGFNVTTSKDNYRDIPSPYFRVNPGELVEFSFLLGDIAASATRHFAVFALLGWEQIAINGNAVLHIRLNYDHDGVLMPQIGTFTFVAPYEPGYYEFLAYAIGVSDDEMSPFSNSDNSFRITLIVE